MRKIIISPLKGYITRNMDLLSDNDIFIKFVMAGHEDQLTSVRQDEKISVWSGQQFIFEEQQRKQDNLLTLKIYDEDLLVNEQVGVAQIDLSPYFGNFQIVQSKQSVIEGFVRIINHDKPAGKVLIRIKPESISGPCVTRKFLSNPDINYYDPSKHFPYESDFQKEGNVLAIVSKQLGQKQLKSYQNQNPTQKNYQYFNNNNNDNINNYLYSALKPPNTSRRLVTQPTTTSQYQTSTTYIPMPNRSSVQRPGTNNYVTNYGWPTYHLQTPLASNQQLNPNIDFRQARTADIYAGNINSSHSRRISEFQHSYSQQKPIRLNISYQSPTQQYVIQAPQVIYNVNQNNNYNFLSSYQSPYVISPY